MRVVWISPEAIGSCLKRRTRGACFAGSAGQLPSNEDGKTMRYGYEKGDNDLLL